MAKKAAIPYVNSPDRAVNQALAALKENVEIMNGSRPGYGMLPLLAPTATLAQVITAMNRIIDRLNYNGE